VGDSHLFTLPDRKFASVPGSGLGQGYLKLNPSFPNAPAGAVPAIAAGIDKTSHAASVARCDPNLRCANRHPLASIEDVPRIFLSPNFNRDNTVLAALTRGGLLRSTDGAETFQPVAVAATASGSIVTTVQSVVFSSDFDASRATGTVYVSVLGVQPVQGAEQSRGNTYGGVYESHDGARTWRQIGAGTALVRGAGALALTGDGRLLAGYLMDTSGKPGVLCTVDRANWAAACPALRASDRGRAVHPAVDKAGTPGRPSTSVAAAPLAAESRADTGGGANPQRSSHNSSAQRDLLFGILGVVAALSAGVWWLLRRAARRRRVSPRNSLD